jgi:hypothetical protein
VVLNLGRRHDPIVPCPRWSSGNIPEAWPRRGSCRGLGLALYSRRVRVHRIFRSDVRTGFLVTVDHRDLERLVTLNERDLDDPLPDGMPVELVDTDDDGVSLLATDFPWLIGNVPVFTEAAYQRLSPLLVRSGRDFSLLTEDGTTFVAFFVDHVVDALDLSASEISRFADGRVMTIDRYVFLPEAIGDAVMFRLANIPRAGWTYVTDEYVEMVRDSGLSGADFDLVWTDEDT